MIAGYEGVAIGVFGDGHPSMQSGVYACDWHWCFFADVSSTGCAEWTRLVTEPPGAWHEPADVE